MKQSLAGFSMNKETVIGEGYALLHQYSTNIILPLLAKTGTTISTVELTTCGLISDLLTGKEGASSYFILGITPYTSEMKIKLGISKELLVHDGPGTVSSQTARELAEKIRLYAKSDIGLAETGMLPTDFHQRRTRKRAGEVFMAISTKSNTTSFKFELTSDLPRLLMRHEIAWNVLSILETFLASDSLPLR